MMDVLPWILFLAVVAAVVGFFAGRLSLRASPPAPKGSAGGTTTGMAKALEGNRTANASPLAVARAGAASTPVVAAKSLSAAPRDNMSAIPANLLQQAKSWGYQLQNLDVARAAASPFDLLVVDYAREEADARAWKPAEIERLKAKPDGGRRIVVAYC